MRRGSIVVVVAAITLAGCGGQQKPAASKAFCTAVDKYNNEITREIKRGKINAERQTARVADIARTAPKGIKHDAETFLDAMRRVETDPTFKKGDPDIKRAVDNVLRYANQACGVYDRKSGI